MQFRSSAFFVLFFLTPIVSFAQAPLVSKWEKIGPVNFTALVHQSPTRIVAATDHGYLYITDDDGNTWQRQEIGDTLDLMDISFGDSLHGVILTQEGGGNNQLFTTDGGQTWKMETVSAVPGPFHVVCLGADTIFEVNWIGNIYRSIDAGATWVEEFTVSDTATSTSSLPSRIIFYNNKRGFVIGGGGMYESTTDGGEHWIYKDIAGDSSAWLNDLDFYNEDTGVAAGMQAYYVTTDGGASWTAHPSPHDDRNDNYFDVRFFGPTNFFIFGGPNPYYFTSNDLGATLNLTQMPQATSIYSIVRTQTGGWLATGGGWWQGEQRGESGTIIRGTYNPENITPRWSVLDECPLGPGATLHATTGAVLQCVSGSVNASLLTYPLISTDSGFFWHVADTRYQGYTGFHFPSPDTGYLFGTGMRTTDSGRSWKPVLMNIPQGQTLSQIAFGSQNIGYAVTGNTGYVLTTSDAGINWKIDSLLPIPESPFPGFKAYTRWLGNVSSPDGAHAFLTVATFDTLINRDTKKYKSVWDSLKEQHRIYRTTNGGVTWSDFTDVPTGDGWGTLNFRTDSIGYLLSDSGRLYRTSDGGVSWNMEQLASFRQSFHAINFLNDRIGFLAADTQAILETTDGGLNWIWVPIPTNREEYAMAVQSIIFPDSNTILLSAVRSLYPSPFYSGEYELYRAKLNLPLASVSQQSASVPKDDLAISVYPNPAPASSLHVRVSSAQAEAARIEILDMLGRIVLVGSAETNADFSLAIERLPAGAYILRCRAGNESAMTPFTIAQ